MNAGEFCRSVTASDLGFSLEKEGGVPRHAFAQWVRVLLQNWRQGTVGVKGRSDVSYSNKKPWKQKGTGRARAGSARSPLWVGGGVTFGPQPRVKELRVTRNLRDSVRCALVKHRLDGEQIYFVDWTLDGQLPRTAMAYRMLVQARLLDGPLTLFLNHADLAIYLSFVNISKVSIVFFDQANAYDLARAGRWVILKKDVETFKQMVAQWI